MCPKFWYRKRPVLRFLAGQQRDPIVREQHLNRLDLRACRPKHHGLAHDIAAEAEIGGIVGVALEIGRRGACLDEAVLPPNMIPAIQLYDRGLRRSRASGLTARMTIIRSLN